MHELFPNWMSKVSPQIDSNRLALRWNAAKAAADAADKTSAVQLCEQALGYSADATEKLRDAARKEDSTYVTSDDALELTVLAAGSVAYLMGKKVPTGGIAATAIASNT